MPRFTLLPLMVASIMQASSPAHVVMQDSLAATRAGEPRAVICPDGAIWLFWHWTAVSRHDSSELDTSRSGVFCRLMAPNGKDILPPRRVMRRGKDLPGYPALPGTYVPVATEDGGVVLFANTNRASHLHTSPMTADVIAIDRKGRLISASLDVPLVRSPAGAYPTRKVDYLSSCSDPGGDLHCFLYDQGDPGRTYLASVVVRRKADRLELNSFREWNTHAPYSLRAPHLRWIREPRDCYDIACIGPDTLLVAYVPGQGEFDRYWPGRYPGDTLIVQHLRLSGLGLIDSLRVDVAAVAGLDYQGVRICRATLQKTTTGFTLFVPEAWGTRSFLLTRGGRPVLGLRSAGDVRPFSAFSGQGTQLLAFRGYLTTQYADWFGITESGEFCAEVGVEHVE